MLEDETGRLLGYFIAMAGVDEMHLLNVTVAPAWQGQGLGRLMLEALAAHARGRGMASLWLIQSPHGGKKYRGLWLRLAADIGQCTAITVYLILRLAIGDWHIYPFSCLIACWIFVCHLVLRDAERIYTVEKLARKIEKHGILQLRAGD